MLDWPTVIAQVVNFLILVYLLKRFLYGPVIRAMDAREAKIASRLQEAAEQRKQAEAEAETFRKKNQDLDASRDEMLAAARKDAAAERAQLIEQTRSEVDKLQARWRDSVQRAKDAFLHDLRERATRQTFALARRALADLSDATLEQRIIDAFIARFQGLGEEEKRAFAQPAAEGEAKKPLVAVRSGFDLPEDRREQIRGLVREQIGEGIEVGFDTSPDLICGIELRAGGRKLAWSVGDYLARLEEGLAQAFEEQGGEGTLTPALSPREREDEAPSPQLPLPEGEGEEKKNG